MLEYKKDYKAWLYLGIPLILLSVFTFYPLINTVLVSLFSQYDNLNHSYGSVFNLDAYNIITNRFFLGSIVNTLIIVFVSVPISTIIALLIAVALNQIKALKKFFQIIFFTPYVTNVLAIGMVFAIMFSHPKVPGLAPEGLINTIFSLTTNWVGPGAEKTKWMFVVLVYITWNALPFKILVFIGGLQNISAQYYDAAKIDGATPRKTLWRITVPLLSPIISYILITSFIGSFKTYESVLAVAGDQSGLHPKRLTIVAFVYDKINKVYLPGSGEISEYSRGAAGAVILFIIILIFTLINLYVSKKRVHY